MRHTAALILAFAFAAAPLAAQHEHATYAIGDPRQTVVRRVVPYPQIIPSHQWTRVEWNEELDTLGLWSPERPDILRIPNDGSFAKRSSWSFAVAGRWWETGASEEGVRAVRIVLNGFPLCGQTSPPMPGVEETHVSTGCSLDWGFGSHHDLWVEVYQSSGQWLEWTADGSGFSAIMVSPEVQGCETDGCIVRHVPE